MNNDAWSLSFYLVINGNSENTLLIAYLLDPGLIKIGINLAEIHSLTTTHHFYECEIPVNNMTK